MTSSQIMSLLDGFSGYIHVFVNKSDKHKTTFTTKWGTYVFNCMHFGLVNVGATFQRAMHTTFDDLISVIILIYLDDMNVYSKLRYDHFEHLKTFFIHCHKFGISLNPLKTIFGVKSEKLINHIVSESGTSIDTKIVNFIKNLYHPTSIKNIQSFMGKFSFV